MGIKYRYKAVVDQTQLCSEFDLGHSQIVISISDTPNRNFRFGISMSEMWPYPKSNLGYPKSDLEHGQIWTLNAPNLIISQIHLGKFGTQLGFGYMIPNPTMIQIYLDKFGTWSSLGIKCFKLNLSQIYPGGFGNVPNLTMS